jgi:predicted DCC family thiol-disulfide oxidoreductase YuxK
MDRLTVVYDASCHFCARCRWWLSRQPSYIPLEFLPQNSALLRERYPTLRLPDGKAELIVIDDDNAVYREDEAFLMCLYALREYRAWSLRLAEPAMRPLARAFFSQLSTRRHAFSRLLGPDTDQGEWNSFLETPLKKASDDLCGCGPSQPGDSPGTCSKPA